MSHYKTITEVFDILNDNKVSYLVLRNYENLLEPEMYIDGHGDVDLLCADSQEIARLLKAETTRNVTPPFIGDGTHYHIYVDGEKVSLDLRYVGDDYYCEQWEKDLLDKRVGHDGFYVMDEENYFYTLIYHAILQKPSLSDEYLHRLINMAGASGISLNDKSEKGLLRALENYMTRHGYYFVYPYDYLVPARFSLVSSSLIKRTKQRWLTHKKYWTRRRIIEFLVRVKHYILRYKG